MFLDDKLLKMCEESEINTPEDVQEFNNNIFQKCMSHFNKNLNDYSTQKEIKTAIDRIFNLFDSFVKNAKKSNIREVKILGEMFEIYTFKKQFLADEKINEIYNKL